MSEQSDQVNLQSYEVKKMLNSMKVPDVIAQRSIGSAKMKNETIDTVIQNSQTEDLGNIFWNECCKMILNDALEASERLAVSSQQWFQSTRQLYLMITRNPQYMKILEMFFDTRPLTPVQSAIGAQLMEKVYDIIISTAVDKVKEEESAQPITFKVRDMPPEGLAKLRYVGAWAVQKVLVNNRKFVRENMGSTNPATHKSVQERLAICNLIEDHLVANISKLQQSSKCPNTLTVTENKQYRNHGLSHGEDSVFDLEASRIDNMNERKLAFAKDLIEQGLDSMKKSELARKVASLFP